MAIEEAEMDREVLVARGLADIVLAVDEKGDPLVRTVVVDTGVKD